MIDRLYLALTSAIVTPPLTATHRESANSVLNERYKLRILGDHVLEDASGRLIHEVLAQPKRFALLAYLVVDGPFRVHTRDELLGVFWPEQTQQSGRNSLAQALSFLRRHLGSDLIENHGPHAVRANQSRITCDAVDLLTAINAQTISDPQTLLGRQLLPGLHITGAEGFEYWLESQRSRLRSGARKLFRSMIRRKRDRGRRAEAVAWAQVATQVEPNEELFVRALMELLAEEGDRIAAFEAYDRHADSLSRHLELHPSQELAAFRDALRHTEPSALAAPTDHSETASSIGHAEVSGTEVIRVPARHALPRRVHATLLTLICFGGGVFWYRGSRADAAPTSTRVSLVFDDSVRVRSELNLTLLAIDPAGGRIAYVGGAGSERLYVRALSDSVPRPLPGTEGARMPQFTSDGQRIVFRDDGEIKSVSLVDGSIRTLVDAANRFSVGVSDAMLYERAFGDRGRSGLMYRPADAASAREVTTVDTSRSEIGHFWPYLLPDGRHALFVVGHADTDSSELAILRLQDSKVVPLGIKGLNPRFVAPDIIVFGRRSGELMAVQIDVERMRLTTRAVPVLRDVRVADAGATQADISPIGTLVYLKSDNMRRIAQFDPSTRSSRIMTEPLPISALRLSPDERKLAIVLQTAGKRDIHLVSLSTGSVARFTNDGTSDSPEFSPDGLRLYWRTERNARSLIVSQPIDKTRPVEDFMHIASSAVWSPSEDIVAVATSSRDYQEARFGPMLRIMNIERGRPSKMLKQFRGMRPTFSPDGSLLAYVTTDPDVRTVRVREMRAPFRDIVVSSTGGGDPTWIANRELMFRNNSQLVAAKIAWDSAPHVETLRDMLTDSFWSAWNTNTPKAVARRNRFFVLGETSGNPEQPRVVFNWLNEVRERLSGAPRQ